MEKACLSPLDVREICWFVWARLVCSHHGAGAVPGGQVPSKLRASGCRWGLRAGKLNLEALER